MAKKLFVFRLLRYTIYSENLRTISKFDWGRQWTIPGPGQGSNPGSGTKAPNGILGRCSTLLNGKMWFFGGSFREWPYHNWGSDRNMIQQVTDCGLDRWNKRMGKIGTMPIPLHSHTCNTFSFDVERAWICFTKRFASQNGCWRWINSTYVFIENSFRRK